MIHFIHRGMGGKYTNYVSQTVRNIARMRPVELSALTPSSPGYRVAIHHTGTPLTGSKLEELLKNQQVTFFFGDSRGLPKETLQEANEVLSVSSLRVPHQLEAAIITGEIENLLMASRSVV